LGGLSLALHRINKAATVARGRAIAIAKAKSTYIKASDDIGEKLMQAAIDDINQKRDLKREEAQQQWIELYGEEEDCKDQEDEMMQDDEEESNVDSSTAESIESEEDDSDESAEEEEEEDYSEAEEIDSEDGEEEEDADLSSEQQETLTNRLFELRAYQLHEQQTFIARLEAQAAGRVGPETPMTTCLEVANKSDAA